MMPWYVLAAIFLAGTAAAYGLVALQRKHPLQRSLLDIPNERSSHSIPTPRGGGLAVVVLTLAAALVYGIFHQNWLPVGGYILGGILIAWLGWRDDVRSLPARVRLAVHTLVAVLTIAACGYFTTLPFPFTSGLSLGLFGIPLTLLWIVGLTNAYNFMDGIDGIAGGTAVAAGLGWLILLAGPLAGGDSLAFWLALALAAGSLGFLGHNWQPARIFMGDVCSGFLGYTLAMIPLLAGRHPSQPWMAGVMLLWVFILDAGITFIRRFLRRERVFSAHRGHLYQRMVSAGFSHATVSTVYILLSLVGILLAWGWVSQTAWSGWVILIGIPIFWAGFSLAATRYRFFTSLTAYLSLGLHLGPLWLVQRVWFTLLNRLGLAQHQLPAKVWADLPLKHWLKPGIPSDAGGYFAWRTRHQPAWFFNNSPQYPRGAAWDTHQSVQMAERVLAGEWQYFGWQWLRSGFPPDWHAEPLTGTRFDPSAHYSRISEYGEYDIKYAWEASRLSMVYPLMRAYAASGDEKYAAAFWQLVEDWMEKNQPYQGVNWVGGQEAALRVLALCFGWYTFKQSPHTTAQRAAALACLVGALARRLEVSLPFAIHTGNNHAISESFGLWLCGTLFPELRGADRYRARGRAHLYRQAMRQLFTDGGYSMYSINYQRFVWQLLVLAVRLAEIHGQPFPPALKERLSHSIGFLQALLDPQTGRVPSFGSNDGALILPLDGCDYTDYRPTLQLLALTCEGNRALPPGPWDETAWWLFGAGAIQASLREQLAIPGSFPDAGMTVLQDSVSRVYLRAVNHRNRPSHADQLHLDLWVGSFNLALDAGTYLYHGADFWQNGLARTAAHNTVTVDGSDQMHWLSRFTWARWSTGKVLRQDNNSWVASHNGYHRLGDPVSHQRQVTGLGNGAWLIQDELTGRQTHEYCLHWLLADCEYQLESRDGYQIIHLAYPDHPCQVYLLQPAGAAIALTRASTTSTAGWYSNYYGSKDPAISFTLKLRGVTSHFTTLFAPVAKNLTDADVKDLLQNKK